MKNIILLIITFILQNTVSAQISGKKITLTKNKENKIRYQSDNLKIEILDPFYEWGTESPDSNESFHYIHQTVLITTKTTQKKFNFYDYQLKNGFHLSIDNYKIIPLNIKWEPYSIEMTIHTK